MVKSGDGWQVRSQACIPTSKPTISSKADRLSKLRSALCKNAKRAERANISCGNAPLCKLCNPRMAISQQKQAAHTGQRKPRPHKTKAQLLIGKLGRDEQKSPKRKKNKTLCANSAHLPTRNSLSLLHPTALESIQHVLSTCVSSRPPPLYKSFSLNRFFFQK